MIGMCKKIYFVGTEFTRMVLQLEYSSKLDQYNGCWCPDPLHHQVISSHNTVCNVDIAAFIGRGFFQNLWCLSVNDWCVMQMYFCTYHTKTSRKIVKSPAPCASRIMFTVPIHSQVRFTLPVNNEQIWVHNPCRLLTAYQQNQCQDQWLDNYQLHSDLMQLWCDELQTHLFDMLIELKPSCILRLHMHRCTHCHI